MKKLLITGGAGFIGSNFINHLFRKEGFDGIIINVDKLTYAGNLENLEDVYFKYHEKRYFFEKVDICNFPKMDNVFKKYHPDIIVHFAAESHVDRSIAKPKAFIDTNIIGTYNLLELAKKYWNKRSDVLFHHISTDEVYGSLEDNDKKFKEQSCYRPQNPYSASKASADHLVRSYQNTYNLSTTISISSNNYGPYQHQEKFIPKMVFNMLNEKPLCIYGDGKNIRDWIYVEDNCSAIWQIIQRGKIGESYNIAGRNELRNIDLLNLICEIVAEKTTKSSEYYKQLITHVKDRPGHDKRYALNCQKIQTQLGWEAETNFQEGLEKIIEWFIEKFKTG